MTPVTELAVTRELRLSGEAAAATEARRFVASVLAGWAMSDLLDDVCIVTSELVTNALLHAGTDIEVSIVRIGERELRVGVSDSDTSGVLPPLELPTRQPSLLEDTSDDDV